MYSPFPPVSVSRCAPFAWLRIDILALLIAPPLESVTVPRILPPVLCANPADTHTNAKILIAKTLLLKIARKNFFEFMDYPPSLEAWNLHRIFEVAVPRKPYYNPVNLWNAGCDVKQKEFIQTIDFPRAPGLAAHQRSRAPCRHFF